MAGKDLEALRRAIAATETHNSEHAAATIEVESAKTRLGELQAGPKVKARGKGKKGKGKQRQGGGRKRAAKDPMIGKQVSMPAAYWHIMDDDEGGFVGKILKAATWKCHGKKLEGYEIRFIDGIQLVPTADFLEHVI